MANFGAKILSNATSSLAAQQAVLANIGNNIANVNTAGYTRRVLDLQTRKGTSDVGALNIGNGVQIGDIIRVIDKYVEENLRQSTGVSGRANVENEFLERIQGLFDLTGDKPTIGNSVTNFFNAVNDLAVDPASIELRANVLERAQDVVTTIRNTYNAIADLQTEADTRIESEISVVNSITSKIAELNGLITQREAFGTTAADERDQRDLLLKQLSEKISFDQVEANDGSITVTLKSGFALVNGTTSRNLDFTASPSFAGGNVPQSLDGGSLRYITFDYNPSGAGADVDFTQSIMNGEGTIAGLLRVRGFNDASNTTPFEGTGILVEMASRVEGIARNFLVDFNRRYKAVDLGDEDGVAAGFQSQAGDLNGLPPDAFGLFTYDTQGLGSPDRDGDGLASNLDLNDITVTGAGIFNFASRMELAFTDPTRLAAARDSDIVAGSISIQSGNNENLTAVALLQNSTQIFTAGSGAYSLTGTYDQAYNESVTNVGNAKARAEIEASVAEANLVSAQSQRDSVSGVSLDEEFANLIRYQRAYQASAKMIRVADELLDQIVSLL